MEVVGNLSGLDRTAPIAFVPTMGALHAGHAELIKCARTYTPNVLVSVFLNPLQFDDPADLLKYPRTPEADSEIAKAAGASTIWFPEMKQIYPSGFKRIPTPARGEVFEGVHRSGHFGGVLSAVSALFSAVEPRWAIFGEKDFQQLFLIKEMTRRFKSKIVIVGVPTVRDSDGLAISSRNVRLSAEGREVALVIPRALRNAARQKDLKLAQEVLIKEFSEEKRFTLDYAAIVDEDNLTLATEKTRAGRALVAGWVGGVRLIDNMAVKMRGNMAVTSGEE